ncbi:MAG: cupin domain-containing protein [Chloroflexi bacterium]|nr:cupin domain-containing protein [Chloroflexota bacterium]
MKIDKGPWLFGSFFLGGFECSTHLTLEGHRLDMIAATQHDLLAQEDYRLCRAAGINAIRESARWPIADRRGALHLGSVRKLARLGREEGMIQIWDLMHYGYPDDLDPFSTEFVTRFAAFARAVATIVREESEGQSWYTPINEISYTAWAAGEVGYMAPFAHSRGGDYKRVLVKAAIAATNAIWEVDPAACILTVDPLVHLHAPVGRPDLKPQADFFNRYVVTEAFDLLAGRIEPELGGSKAHLGVVGFNYYAGNQWTIPTPELPQRFLDWADPQWVPLSRMLVELGARYEAPLIIAETGSSADERALWLAHLTGEVQQALAEGVNLQGICLYPVISSPDWEDPTAFFDGGVFDVAPQPGGKLTRVLSPVVAGALHSAQDILDPGHTIDGALLRIEGQEAAVTTYGFVKPLESVRFKPDNFSYRTLAAGNDLIVEVYGFEPGGSLPSHRHNQTEHVLTFLSGRGAVCIGDRCIKVQEGESIVIPAGLYHSIINYTTQRLVVQQVSAPRPWDARFDGPHPANLEAAGSQGG